MTVDDDKCAAARAAVAEVADGMLVGLGTGSTAAYAIVALGQRARHGLRIETVATSRAAAALAIAHGLSVRDFADVATVDLTIDGADQIDARLWAVKGAGGAMLREKVVAAASRRMVVVADAAKRVGAIGGVPVPVETLPFATGFVVAALARLGATPTLRSIGGAAVVTDNGNRIVDCSFDTMPDFPTLATELMRIPGVLGHGLFLDEVDAAYIAEGGVVTRLERSRASG